MGLYVHLHARADSITARAWRDVYEESWRVLEAYPDDLRTLGYRVVAGERVVVHQRKLEVELQDGGRGWRVSGDLRTKRSAESFDFPECFGKAVSFDLPKRPCGRARDELRTQSMPSSGCVLEANPNLG